MPSPGQQGSQLEAVSGGRVGHGGAGQQVLEGGGQHLLVRERRPSIACTIPDLGGWSFC